MLKICGTTLIDDKRPPQTECQHIPDQITPVTASGDTKKNSFRKSLFFSPCPLGSICLIRFLPESQLAPALCEVVVSFISPSTVLLLLCLSKPRLFWFVNPFFKIFIF